MSVINKLKLTTAKREGKLSPVVLRRQKLCSKITEQLAMAQAKKDGKAYAATKIKRVIDAETGVAREVEVSKRVKEWYWIDGNKVLLQIMYGTKPLTLNSKGANTVEVGSGVELLNTLSALKDAVASGEFDEAIEAASKSIRQRFAK